MSSREARQHACAQRQARPAAGRRRRRAAARAQRHEAPAPATGRRGGPPAAQRQEEEGGRAADTAVRRGAAAAALAVLMSVVPPADLRPVVPAAATDAQAAPSNRKLDVEERSTIYLFEKTTPGVVFVTNVGAVRDSFTLALQDVPMGAGSGLVYDADGHVVTNYHVIKGAREVTVTFTGEDDPANARIVGFDADKDIAVLQLDPETITRARERTRIRPLDIGTSDDLLVGQKVFAIGNPFGLDHTMTQGIISGLGREIMGVGGRPIRDVIQTDAAINPGNSGGPLMDSSGCVIGINVAIADPSGRGANTGVAFAIPIDTVKPIVDQIVRYGRVIRPQLGVTIAPEATLRALGTQGVLVLNVDPSSGAGLAGMLPTKRDAQGSLILGDIIVRIESRTIKGSSDLFAALDDCKVGDTIDVEVLRESTTAAPRKEILKVLLAERPKPPPDPFGLAQILSGPEVPPGSGG